MSLRSSYQKLSRPYRKMIGVGVLACISWVAWQVIGYPLQTRSLIDAVNEGNISQARCLLRWGARPNQSKEIAFWDIDNCCGPWTALDVADYRGRTDFARLFLDNGAAINQTDRYGDTTLMWAVRHGPSDTIPFLLAHGANTRARDADGNNLVQIAVTSKLGRQLELFMNCGIDINATSKYGGTAIEDAVRNNSVEEARILLAHGADWKHCSSKETCVWLNVAKQGEATILKLLIEHGADVNVCIHGSTALETAALNGQVEVTRLLLQQGANPNIKICVQSAFKSTPLGPYQPVSLLKVLNTNRVVSKRKNAIIQLLKEAGAK